MIRIGLISDTHGLLRPAALEWLAGSDAILHGGDVGDAAILERLARIAPLTAVRGNNDTADWANALRETETLRLAGVVIHVLHDLKELALDPRAAGVSVVVSGHSHRPRAEQRDGVWYVNPGSAGPRRFKLPIAAGELVVDGSNVTPRLINLG